MTHFGVIHAVPFVRSMVIRKFDFPHQALPPGTTLEGAGASSPFQKANLSVNPPGAFGGDDAVMPHTMAKNGVEEVGTWQSR